MENKEKKFTKKENFVTLLAIVENFKTDTETTERLTKFINKEIELLTKKSGSKKVNEQNEKIKKMIINALEVNEKKMTITQILELEEFQNYIVSTDKETNEIKKLSNQKISALMTQLIDEKRVERVTEKKKSYFQLLKVDNEVIEINEEEE